MKEKINIPAFFKDSKAVWVSENFQNIILGNYSPIEHNQQNGPVDSSALQDLRSGINPQELVFQDADAFLEQLAYLIKNQMHGEEGQLLNDSSANYFFLKGKDGKLYSVLVRWEHAQKLWRCGAYLQEGLKLPNVRIFYPSQV